MEIRAPTIILRAEKATSSTGAPNSVSGDFSTSPTDPDLVKLFAPGVAKDVHLKDGMTHFIPMQNPDLVAGHIGSLLLSAAGRI
jgi:hypothetical protein